MHDRYQQGDQDIKAAHNRHKGRSNLDDTLAAAEDAVTHQYRQNRADHPRGNGGIIKAVDAEGGLQVIGGEHIEAAGVGKQQADAEQHGQRTAVQGRFDVIGGAAVASALGISLFIDLGKSALDEGGSAADDGNQPHPKHRAVAAEADGGGNTDDVAGADAGRG